MKICTAKSALPVATAVGLALLMPQLASRASAPPDQTNGVSHIHLDKKVSGKGAKTAERREPKALAAHHPQTADTRQYVIPGAVPEDTQRDATNWRLSEESKRAAEMKAAAGDMTGAEDAYRLAVSLNGGNFEAWKGLSKTLEQEGKTQEAISAYRYLLYPKLGAFTSLEQDETLRLHFALLLAGDGQWPEAVQVYENTIWNVRLGHSYEGLSYPALSVHFTPDNPQPQLFAAMCHIALGVEHSLSSGENTQALADYAEALRLQPDLALANFYYAYGLRRVGQPEQAKAAYAAAERLGDGEVQAVAKAEIKHL